MLGLKSVSASEDVIGDIEDTKVLNSRQPQSVPTMPTSLWWNHLSDHPLVQWGITRGVLQETSLPRKGLFKKNLTSSLLPSHIDVL